MITVLDQLRAIVAQLEAGGAAAQRSAMKLLPYTDNPREAMKLTEDGKHFAAPFWMDGYVGALPGVALNTWANENYAVGAIGGQAVALNHLKVLMPNMGQIHVSPADLGWGDYLAATFDPDQYTDDTDCLAAWNAAGRPTVGLRGVLGHLGRYLKPGDGHAIGL